MTAILLCKQWGRLSKEMIYLVMSFHATLKNIWLFYIGNHLTFIDSFQFMSSSLDQLTENLLEN